MSCSHMRLAEDEKEKILDALKDGQSWLDSNPEADAEEIKEKHKEIEGICAPIAASERAFQELETLVSSWF